MTEKKLIDLTGLQAALQKVNEVKADKSELEALKSRFGEIVDKGGEPNKIDKIKVNGKEQSISETDKSVDITIPTTIEGLSDSNLYAKKTDVTDMLEDYVTDEDLDEAVSDLGYITSEEVDSKIAETKHAKFKEVSDLPEVDTADENTMYLKKKSEDPNDTYDIYIVTGSDESKQWTKIDDTNVSLVGYATTEEVQELLQSYVKESELGAKVGEAGYIKASEVESEYAKKSDLDDYTPTNELGLDEYLKTENLGEEAKKVGFATQTEIDKRYGYDGDAHKVLSQKNFTEELETKLKGIKDNATKVSVPTNKNGVITINDEDNTVYTLPETVLHDTSIASVEEVDEMLDSVFTIASS